MELRQFIKAALIDIVSAIRETQAEVKEYATISPLTGRSEKITAIQMKDGLADISTVDFDVAITIGTEENTEKGIKAGINVVGIFNAIAATKGDGTVTYQNISRIRFSIPVLLPHSAPLDE